MVKEIKIGILFIIVFLACLWGYKYIEGKNLLDNRKTIYAIYDNVDQLTKAAPVKINGYQIGTVVDISLNPDNVKSIIVTMDIDGNINYPKNTTASIKSAGVVSGKEIELSFDALCRDNNCLENGDYVDGRAMGFVESLVGTDDLESYADDFKQMVAGALDTINASLSAADPNAPINKTFNDIQTSVENVARATAALDKLLRSNQANMTQTFKNLSSLTNTLASSQGDIQGLISDLGQVMSQINQADVGKTIGLTNTTIANANDMITDLSGTLSSVDSSFVQLNNIVGKINEGDGMLSKIMNDPEVYDNLNDASRHLALLLQDLRLNPKRYVRLSVFGRKGNAYTNPEDDPAFELELNK